MPISPQELFATSIQVHCEAVPISGPPSSQRPSSLAVLQAQGNSSEAAVHNTVLLVVFPSSDTFPSGDKQREINSFQCTGKEITGHS